MNLNKLPFPALVFLTVGLSLTAVALLIDYSDLYPSDPNTKTVLLVGIGFAIFSVLAWALLLRQLPSPVPDGKMKQSQKLALTVGVSAAIVMCLFPPFEVFGGYFFPAIVYSFISRPPTDVSSEGPPVIAWGLLWFQLFLVTAFTLIVFWGGRKRLE